MIRQLLSRLLAALAFAGLMVATGACVPAVARAPWQNAPGPALWAVEDEDTTIYLFGTIHALPPDVPWFEGPVARALTEADSFVTELPMSVMRSPEAANYIAGRAVLPRGENLRDRLSPEQRAQFEAALERLGMPPGAFDPFKPWFAAWQLSLLPLQAHGYDADSGVEVQLEARLSPEVKRESLETLTHQIDMFDTMPPDEQIAYLIRTSGAVDAAQPALDAIVAQWVRGNHRAVARLLNPADQDAELAKRLIYDRNAAWADWVAERLSQPGRVFVAVGAGHLAGTRSVQAALQARGLKVKRVQ